MLVMYLTSRKWLSLNGWLPSLLQRLEGVKLNEKGPCIYEDMIGMNTVIDCRFKS